MVTLIVSLSEGYGHEHFTVALMTALKPHLHCPCLDLHLNGQRKTETLAESITNAAVAITKAFSPPTSTAQQPEQSQQVPLNLNPPSVVMSPGKSVELRMKNFQQLRFLQQLFEDNILSETEFLEQKRNILDSLRKLNN